MARRSKTSGLTKRGLSRKRMGRPPTTGKGVLVGVRCHNEFLTAVDQWRAAQADKPSKPAAIRQLAEIGLANAHRPARPGRGKRGRAAADMAGRAIDNLADQSVTVEDRAKRKRRLLKGPKEFREMRDNLSGTQGKK